jgi:cytidylate kinase
MDKKITIAIDGFSSSGKSSMAKWLAKELGYTYVDSGAMYRAVTLYCLKNNLISENGIDIETLKSKINDIKISFKQNAETGVSETYLNGENVEKQIRTLEVSNYVSPVSAIKFVREALVKQQREMGKKKGIVMDGRDIGTVVFPDAELKLFVTASPEIRAERRFEEMRKKGENVSFDKILENIKKRDSIDQNRKESPLRKADDAIILDNSNMSIEEQHKYIKSLVHSRR